MDNAAADSEGALLSARAIDDIHTLVKAARIVRAALARQVGDPKSSRNGAKQDAQDSRHQ